MNSEERDLSELRETGLLWLINTTVFHPRGYALALHIADDGCCTGWSLDGDGTEPWVFASAAEDPNGVPFDDLFAAAKALMP